MKTMATIAKGLMLAAIMTVGAQNVQAQDEETKLAPADANEWWQGEEVKGNGQEVYLYNVGAGIFVTGEKAEIKNIDEAATWNINGSSPYTIECNNDAQDKIHLECTIKTTNTWTASVGKTASKLTLVSGTTKDKGYCYKFSVTENVGTIFNKHDETRYFNVEDTKYTPAKTAGPLNDFLFISAEQKEAYSEYKNLFNEANDYTSNEKVSTTLLSDLKDVLTNASKSTYASYSSDESNLKDIIKKIEDYLKNISTGIDEVANTNSTKQAAIYNANGVRISKMQKGINIVKMSNGDTKKVLVK